MIHLRSGRPPLVPSVAAVLALFAVGGLLEG
jgi:hypothetical protein